MKFAISLIALTAAFPAFAQDTRELDAHEHGVGTLDIAIDGTTVAMAFEAPGADIVGFEYEAKSDEDLAAIEAALTTLSDPLALFGMPDDAACTVAAAIVELETEDDHDDHGDDDQDDHGDDDHDDHGDEEHDDHGDEEHDDHGDEDHDDHGDDDHDDHGDEEHDDHGDDDHDGHGDEEHDDHDHDEHAEEGGHTAFHAEYMLNCESPDALTEISFAYFDVFENALEVEVQIITASGAQAFEVERDAPMLDLGR